MVTKLRAKVSSDVVRSSGRRAGFWACGIERVSNAVSKSGSSSREAKVYTEPSGVGVVSDMRGLLTANSAFAAVI
jgi:hypothetical protein